MNSEIMHMKGLILLAIHDLISNNGEMVHSTKNVAEMTINHKLAVYIESHLHNLYVQKNFVDLEYDRNNAEPKTATVDGVKSPRRPDILVHTRIDDTVPTQHLLVVEAKKKFNTKDLERDANKIKCLYIIIIN